MPHPKNHRDTENTEPRTCPGIAASRRSRTHVATTNTRRNHKGHPPTPQEPQITQIDADVFKWESRRSQSTSSCPTHPSTQRRGDAERVVGDFIVRRGSGRRTTGNRWVGTPIRMREFVTGSRPSGLRSLSASLATSLLHSIAGRSAPPPLMNEKKSRTDVPRARRPVRSAAATNACVRSSRASHRRQAIVRSPVVLPSISGFSLRAQLLPLCVGGWVDGLRVFVSLWLRREWAGGSA